MCIRNVALARHVGSAFQAAAAILGGLWLRLCCSASLSRRSAVSSMIPHRPVRQPSVLPSFRMAQYPIEHTIGAGCTLGQQRSS